MSVKLERNDLITLVGSVLATVGAFMPMVEIGRLGSVSYAEATEPEVYLLVALAVAASAVLFVGKKAFSLYAAAGAWLVLLWPVVSNIGGGSDDGGLLGKVTDAVKDPLQQVGQKIFSNVFDFEIGGYAFFVGMIVMLVGAALNFKAK